MTGRSAAARRRLAFAILPGTIVAAGCLFAAAGAAGGGIYFTTRGAEKIVQGSVADVAAVVPRAFERLGVSARGEKVEDEGRREVYGRRGEDDVTVELKSETERATRVEVRVRTGAVTWDKEFARRILEEIDALRR